MADDLDRVVGGMQIIGGGVEIILGAAMSVAPEPLTTAGGIVLVVHGGDTVIAGFRTLWYGEVQHSFTQLGASAAAEAIGASPETANAIGIGIDITAGVGPSLGASVSRQLSMNAAKKAGSKAQVVVAYLRKGVNGIGKTGHNMVGVRTNFDGPTVWFEYLGTRQGRVIRTKDVPGASDIVTRFAITGTQAERAMGQAKKLVQAGRSTWSYCGPNCTTTAMSVLRAGGVVVPHWAVTPLLLGRGLRPQNITVIGATLGTTAPDVANDTRGE